MKFYATIPLGILLSTITLYFVADYREHGDTNAVLMYLAVYIPVFIGLSLVNGIVLRLAENRSNNIKVVLALLFPVISLILLSVNHGSLHLIGFTAFVVFVIVNFMWLGFTLKSKSSGTEPQ